MYVLVEVCLKVDLHRYGKYNHVCSSVEIGSVLLLITFLSGNYLPYWTSLSCQWLNMISGQDVKDNQLLTFNPGDISFWLLSLWTLHIFLKCCFKFVLKSFVVFATSIKTHMVLFSDVFSPPVQSYLLSAEIYTSTKFYLVRHLNFLLE